MALLWVARVASGVNKDFGSQLQADENGRDEKLDKETNEGMPAYDLRHGLASRWQATACSIWQTREDQACKPAKGPSRQDWPSLTG